jgi:hypothetical protein
MMRSAWVRRTIRIGLGVLAAVIALAGIATLLFGPRNALLLALILLQPLLANTRPPAILADQVVEGPFGDLKPVFEQKFPLGTDEAVLRATLLRQGFNPQGSDRMLVYRWERFPCSNSVDVWWTVNDHGAITDIGGRWYSGCL